MPCSPRSRAGWGRSSKKPFGAGRSAWPKALGWRSCERATGRSAIVGPRLGAGRSAIVGPRLGAGRSAIGDGAVAASRGGAADRLAGSARGTPGSAPPRASLGAGRSASSSRGASGLGVSIVRVAASAGGLGVSIVRVAGFLGAGRSIPPSIAPALAPWLRANAASGGSKSSRSSVGAGCARTALGAGSSGSSAAASPERIAGIAGLGAGLGGGIAESALGRFGAGRSARSITSLVCSDGGGTTIGGFGIAGGSLGSGGAADAAGSTIRDLQSMHVTNFAPTGALASGTRLSVPQAEQMASIIRTQHTPPTARRRLSSATRLRAGRTRLNVSRSVRTRRIL